MTYPPGPGCLHGDTWQSSRYLAPLGLGRHGRWSLRLHRNSARSVWRSPHSSVEVRGTPATSECPPGSHRLCCLGASPGEAPSQPPVTRPSNIPPVSRDRSTHVPGHVRARRSEGAQNTESRHSVHSQGRDRTRPQHVQHVPRSARGQTTAEPTDGDGHAVQSTLPSDTLGQQSTELRCTGQHPAGQPERSPLKDRTHACPDHTPHTE